MFEGFDFANKEMFWLLLLVPIAIVWYLFKYKNQTSELSVSSLKGFKLTKSILPKLRHLLFILKLAALTLLITALDRKSVV